VYVAERQDRDLGPVPGSLEISVTLTLSERNQARLNAVLANGGRVSPRQWATTYGPGPSQVALVRRALARAGIPSQWHLGDASLTVAAPAAVLERFFQVPVHDFQPRSGGGFYGPVRQPPVPMSVAREVVAVTGMSDYQRDITEAIVGANGVTPAQMTSFYDMTPLRSAGLDGTGMTVMFPEWAMPPAADLSDFATKFGLPAFDVSVNSDPGAWGAPASASSQDYDAVSGEAALDLEVVHGLAPGAREIVYEVGNPADLPAMLQAMVTTHPGAILSSSISMHWCDQEQGAKNDATAEDSVFTQAAAQGTSIFWAAGDRGAFSCLPDGIPATELTLAVQPDASSPHVTSVGGTTVLLSSTGAYYKEAAWGEPLEQWGGGGGVSTFFPQPPWQQGPGVTGLTGRGLPDVSADADVLSGWDTYYPTPNGPQEGPSGGTSAATPCWAAITALIDEDLVNQHLKTVGFANPALYYFATGPKGLPAAPFHEITEGNNLHFPATAGWNEATGLGSPDVAHLADDFAWYDATHPSGS
jgi:kumamolisin